MSQTSIQKKTERGLTAVEVAVVATMLSLGLLAQASVTITSYRQSVVNKERRLALEGARSQIEILKRYDLRSVFPAFDSSKVNDPTGAPGPYFDVQGLRADPAESSGRVGKIIFPVGPAPDPVQNPDPVLREDVQDPRLGMPADLDGDGVIDDQPKDKTYIHLPVIVEVRWEGQLGSQRLRLTTWLVPREK